MLRNAVALRELRIDIVFTEKGDEAPDNYIAIPRADLDAIAASSQLLGSDDLRTASGKRLITQFARPRVLTKRDPEEFQRFTGRMVRSLADGDCGDVPN